MANKSAAGSAAKKKTTTKSKTGTKSTGKNTKSTSRSKKQPEPQVVPIRREVGGVVCLVLALLFFIGCFDVDAIFFHFVGNVVKGMIGYGYWLLPPACLWAGFILLFHRGRPVTLRVCSVFALAFVFGILGHMLWVGTPIFFTNGFSYNWKLLYSSGGAMHSGGVLCGFLSTCLQNLVSVYGAIPILVLLLLLFAALAANLTPAKIGDFMHSRQPYSPDNYPQEQMRFAGPKPKGKRGKKTSDAIAFQAENYYHQIDIPLDEPMAQPKRTRTPAPPAAPPAPPVQQPAPAPAPRKRTKPAPVQTPPPVVKTRDDEVLDVLLDDEYEVDDDSLFIMPRKHRSQVQDPIPEPETIVGKGIPELEHVAHPNSFREIGLTEDRHGDDFPVRPTMYFAGPITVDDDDDVITTEPAAPAERPVEKPSPRKSGSVFDMVGPDTEEDEPVQMPVSEGPKPSAAGMGQFLKGDGIFEEPNKKLTRKETAQGFQEIAAEIAMKDEEEGPEYVFPPLNLLRSRARNVADSQTEAGANRRRLEATLSSFGVEANYVSCTRGPTVTRYDFTLKTGVKLNKLTNLADDIALSLGVGSVRIAPIPDKISTVGIEVPNKVVNTVYLRDIIDSDNFRNAKSKVSFAIGEDIGGNSLVSNIAKLPHLLIAGTTGSGKSVCINCLLLSILYKATPEEVKLIMIDPKMVELGIYNGIPHLYVPVVTDPKKAAGALQWSVVEMMKRYRLFSEAGVRDLAGYNAICQRNGDKTMPQVVIVIDELADLMMVASKEVEESICRVAQMGRAAGMHLVIATQRPSADVITGLMKANIPSRIAFAVSSALESRIILDQQGAEKLIGMGDMLYAPIGLGKPVRIQGAFVSDEERESVIDFVKNHCEAEYDQTVQAEIEKAAVDKDDKNAHGQTAEAHSDYDELLSQAVDVVLDAKQASVSMLQRRLKLGYSRAARIVDQMEEIGVVGPFEGSKPRQILITREQWMEMQTVQGTAPTEIVEGLPEASSDELFGVQH